MLEVTLTARQGQPLVRRATERLEAYHLYLKGKFHLNQRTPDAFSKAAESFDQALKEDANYAAALAGKADYYVMMASWGRDVPRNVRPLARHAARRALELDPNRAEAHVSLGVVRAVYEWDWDAAIGELRRARELNLGHTVTSLLYHMCLMQSGRLAEGRKEAELALQIDPLSVPIRVCCGAAHYFSRLFDESIQHCRRALELNPDDVEAHMVMGCSLTQVGRFREAIDTLERGNTLSAELPSLLGTAYARAGRAADAAETRELLTNAIEDRYATPAARALVDIHLGDDDAAFRGLEQAAADRDTFVCYVGVDPLYDPLRASPRFEALLERIGLRGAQAAS